MEDEEENTETSPESSEIAYGLLFFVLAIWGLAEFSETVARTLDFTHFNMHLFRCPFRTEKIGGEPRPGWFESKGNELWCQYRNKEGAFVKHGLYEAWHANGQKKSEGYFKFGKQNGLWIEWNANGEIEFETKTLNGKTFQKVPGGWEEITN